MTDEHKTERKGSIVDPTYGGGEYFANPQRHVEDAEFKAECFLKLFLPLAQKHGWSVRTYADVGCGSGDVARLVTLGLRKAKFSLDLAKGYDVSPHVTLLQNEHVQYVCDDFSRTDEQVDLVTLFDVFEHVVKPIDFLSDVAKRARLVALHIPLDNSLNNALRDKYRSMLNEPGHLLFMDSVYALNICAHAGLRVIAYEYTFGFRAPSGHRSLLSKIVFPLRVLMSKISPWLLSRTIGGVSLLVVALTPLGLRSNNAE